MSARRETAPASPVDHRGAREVVVVGGGQAGLAIGYFLAQQGRDLVILEAADEPAAAWRARWDSLKLFTPVRYSGLPGLAFPGDPDSYPGRDDVAAYLTDYPRHFALPVEVGSRVRSIRRTEGRYLVELGSISCSRSPTTTRSAQMHCLPTCASSLARMCVSPLPRC
jgi:putative flavoprotein involved in K+ transport